MRWHPSSEVPGAVGTAFQAARSKLSLGPRNLQGNFTAAAYQLVGVGRGVASVRRAIPKRQSCESTGQ